MLEDIVIGIIQGVGEWLPLSSEGLIVLAKTKLFAGEPMRLNDIIRYALFLHLGTFLAAAVYFRKDVGALCHSILHFRKADSSTRKLLIFLLISTAISGALGFLLVQVFVELVYRYHQFGDVLTWLIGIFLIITGLIELNVRTPGKRVIQDITLLDSVILGITQGLAALPGVSRSGSTVALLLLLKFDKICALKISFLMSLPIVLAGNIVLNFSDPAFFKQSWIGIIAAFVFGLATIHLLLKVAEKIKFAYFLFFFGGLVLLSTLI